MQPRCFSVVRSACVVSHTLLFTSPLDAACILVPGRLDVAFCFHAHRHTWCCLISCASPLVFSLAAHASVLPLPFYLLSRLLLVLPLDCTLYFSSHHSFFACPSLRSCFHWSRFLPLFSSHSWICCFLFLFFPSFTFVFLFPSPFLDLRVLLLSVRISVFSSFLSRFLSYFIFLPISGPVAFCSCFFYCLPFCSCFFHCLCIYIFFLSMLGPSHSLPSYLRCSGPVVLVFPFFPSKFLGLRLCAVVFFPISTRPLSPRPNQRVFLLPLSVALR